MENELALYLGALEHIPMGVLVLDAEGNYLYVNQEYCNLVNRPRSFFQNMSIPKLKKMGYLTTNVWEQVMEKQQTVVAAISITDGKNQPFDTLTIGVPVFDRKGQIQYIVYRQEAVSKLMERLQVGMLNKHLYRDAEILQVSDGTDVIAESPQMKHPVCCFQDRCSHFSDGAIRFWQRGAGKAHPPEQCPQRRTSRCAELCRYSGEPDGIGTVWL